MVTGKTTTLHVVLWCAILALAPGLITAQEDPPASPNPHPNPTQRLIRPRNHQSEEQQRSDENECYDWACDQTGWDPYEAYTALVNEGYAVALTREDMGEGLVSLAADGAVTGSVAGDILGDPETGAEIGAAIAVARWVVRSDYLIHQDDPAAKRVVAGFERNLRNWDRKFAACLRPRGYGVSSP